MSGTRIDGLPDRAVVKTLLEQRQAAAERKGSSLKVTGSNLAYFVSESGNAFDWTGQLDSPVGSPSYGQARFDITLTSSRATVPLVDLAVTVYYSTDGGATWGEYTYQRGVAESYNGTPPEIWRNLVVLPGTLNGPGECKFGFHLFGILNTWVAFKLHAPGTDEVTINVTRVV